MTVLTNRLTDKQLAYSYQLLLQHDDKENAEKLVDLYEKKMKREFTISFTGHFSAGKSSLLNYLLGKELLPNSPIPTSANIVKLTSGDGVVRVHFHDAPSVYYEEPYDIDLIQQYCMDRATIKQIDISSKENIIPKHSAFIDTPGIDAADDRDRKMTESSLHVVDMVCYVMDYNHVQSEINLKFLSELKKLQIPLTIVINQIDKHNENELSFTTFKEHVQDTLRTWDIHPKRIFYISVKDKEHVKNELTSFKRYIFQLCNDEANHLDERLYHSFSQIIQEHKILIEEKYEAHAEQHITDVESDKLKIELSHIDEQLDEIEKADRSFEQQFDTTVRETLKNAYLMPASLRDLAARFIEAQDKHFKVGFLLTKRKTQAERERRLSEFHETLQKTIDSTLKWALQNKLAEFIDSYNLRNEEVLTELNKLYVEYDQQRLLTFLKDGATYNNAYVLNYTNEVSNDIKAQYQKRANDFFTSLKRLYKIELEQKEMTLKERKRELQTLLNEVIENERSEKIHSEMIEQIEQVFNVEHVERELLQRLQKRKVERNVCTKEVAPKRVDINEEKQKTENVKTLQEDQEQKQTYHRKETLNQLEQTIDILEENKLLQHTMADLRAKKVRLKDRKTTVALFGAFSAGKSSFANALIGKRLLPVSPNPTTAVINRIQAPTNDFPHCTVVITFKEEQTLINDVKDMLKDAFKETKSFAELLDYVINKRLYENDIVSQMHQAYLRALIDGYEERKDELGCQKTITLDEFASFVTDEKLACYIEMVDLYYDCFITKKGITLVDTPGADSVNARHTNVSFDYIKEADAILYVTYYNHAVTSADRDFLMQLGRVKESFELDKMFFIVNAADLAKDEAELSLVTDYVKDQLLSFGIRHAMTYPLSSKNALRQKEREQTLDRWMQQFERAFYQFIDEDLMQLTLKATVADLFAIKQTIKKMIEQAQMDQTEKDKRIVQINELKTNLKETIERLSTDRLSEQLTERIKRQLHFVLERLYIRFHDMFVEHFNPTTITSSGRQAMKQLEIARSNFIQYVGYELLQEVRAVTLRMEAYGKELIDSFSKQLDERLKAMDRSLMFTTSDDVTFTSPTYKRAFTNLDLTIFQQALQKFKNPRSFFEQNERDVMKEQFYNILKPYAEAYVNEQQRVMIEAYVQQITSWSHQVANDKLTEALTLLKEQVRLLEDVGHIKTLQHVYEQLDAILKDG